MLTLGLAFLAGTLASLSPCVLPLLPLVLGAALGQHRLGPVALAGGLALSFATLGVLLATVGFAAGIDPAAVRVAGALLMIAFGVVLLVPRLQLAFATSAGALVAPLQDVAIRQEGRGLSGQFGLGVLLGAVWAPCTGPALGSAFTLATQAQTAGQAAVIMLVFAIGAAVPLLALAYLARGAMGTAKRGAQSLAAWAKPLLGAALMVFGLMVLTGADKRLEAAILDAAPGWYLEWTTRF
jgi:cytochrome c biogenesis protein CcdA